MAINIIELTGTELVEGLALTQGSMTFEQLVAKFGLSRASQLWAEYGVDGLYLDFGGTAIETGYIASGGAPAAISSTTETALELAQSTEMTASDVYLTTVGKGAMQTGVSSAKTVPLLSLDVGVVGAAVAPLLGVALGAELYRENPQFWTQLSQKLLPFCYPGTTEIPGWLDIIESAITPGTYEAHAVIDQRIIDAIKVFFDEEGIGVQGDKHEGETTIGDRVFSGPITRYEVAPGETRIIGTSVYGGPFDIENNTSKTILFTFISDNFAPFYTLPDNSSLSPSGNLLWHARNANLEVKAVGNIAINQTGYDGSTTRYYGTSDWSRVLTTFAFLATTINNPDFQSHPTIFFARLAQYLQTGTFETQTGYIPEGTSEWDGYTPSLGRYSKPIIYMVEDPNNPGTFIPDPQDGIEIALPDKSTWPKPQVQSTKPENWPEDVEWPIEIEFPWPKPDDYEGDWPASTTWPLPAEKPDYWPNIIYYPNNFPYPAPSNDPEIDPDPNQNSDPAKPAEYVSPSAPGIKTNPAEEDTPSPEDDPSQDPTRPDLALDDPVPDPPPSEGENPESPMPTIIPPFGIETDTVPDGLISVYHPTDAQLKLFAKWLWVTYADPSIDKLWNNPFDGVISLMELYCTPTDIGAKNIRSGFLDSGISSQTISRYTEINCGSITVPEYYGNYLDYSPYSKCHIYLPFIGIVELNVDDIVGHAVNVTYKIDEYNGACIAQITVAKSTTVGEDTVDYSNIMYQFSGNCAVELPLAGGTQSAIRAGLIQAAAYGLSSVIGGVVSGAAGNVGGAISQIGYGAANAIGSVVSAKSSVQHSGSFGSSYGALGVKIPYIIVTRPKQIIVPSYSTIYGYPAHKMVTIGACRGYLRVREVHVLSSTATDEEKKRIEDLLKEGVYVTE